MEDVFSVPLSISYSTPKASFPRIALRSSINVYFEEALRRGLLSTGPCANCSHFLPYSLRIDGLKTQIKNNNLLVRQRRIRGN